MESTDLHGFLPTDLHQFSDFPVSFIISENENVPGIPQDNTVEWSPIQLLYFISLGYGGLICIKMLILYEKGYQVIRRVGQPYLEQRSFSHPFVDF